jgi:hypothetical protein
MGCAMHDGGGGGGGDFGGGFSGGHHGGDFGGHHGVHHGGYSGAGAGGHHRYDGAGAGDPPDPAGFARRLGPRGRRVSRRAWQVYRLVLWAFVIGLILWTTLH